MKRESFDLIAGVLVVVLSVGMLASTLITIGYALGEHSGYRKGYESGKAIGFSNGKVAEIEAGIRDMQHLDPPGYPGYTK